MHGASNRLIEVEDLSEEELHLLRTHYRRLVEMARDDLISPRRIRSKKPNRATPPNADELVVSGFSRTSSWGPALAGPRTANLAIRINASKIRDPLHAGQRPGLISRSVRK